MLVDCLLLTNHGLLFVLFDSDDLNRIRRMAKEINTVIDMTINYEDGSKKEVCVKPNGILLKYCVREGRVKN
jgi:hypothetical protein